MALVPRVVGLTNVPEPSELVLQKALPLFQVPPPPRPVLGFHQTFVLCACETLAEKSPIRKIPIANEWFNFLLILIRLLIKNSVQTKYTLFWDMVKLFTVLVIRVKLLHNSKKANGFLSPL